MMESLLHYNVRIVLAGVTLLGASAGMIGCFAVLRRRALTGDALAHASLPGLCLAFLVVGDRSTPAMLAGALVTGILGITIISALRQWTRIKEDAAIGIVLSVFFGAGIVLRQTILALPTGNKAGLNTYIFGNTASIQSEDVRWIAILSLLTLVVVSILYKEFKLIAFDPDFAKAQGWPVYRLDLLLMGLLAIAVVVGLPAVGVLMIAALLIIPPASARFWTSRLSWMLLLSALFGALSGIIGTFISAAPGSSMPAGATIVLVAVGLFLLSVCIAPQRGLLARVYLRRHRAAG